MPQISTIVQTGLEPTNFDLIDQSETLRAGTVYRSKKPAILGTQAGQKEIEIYLKKEGDLQPRQARIQLPVAATSTHSVSVYVEQTPNGLMSLQRAIVFNPFGFCLCRTDTCTGKGGYSD